MGLVTDYDTLGTQSSKTLASVLDRYANLDSKRQSVAKRRSLARNIAIRFREARMVVCCLCWGRRASRRSSVKTAAVICA